MRVTPLLSSLLLPFPLSVWNAVLSFIDLVESIFTIPGVTVFLSNRIRWTECSINEDELMKIQM